MATQPQSDEVPSSVVAAPLTDQVFETLRGWIVNGKLQAGYRLRVRDLAELVGTSVMPVREAISRLVESGLAVHEPYKGARVRGLAVGELERAYDVRILLEGECARLGAYAARPEVADRMHEHWLVLERAAREGDFAEALERDEALLDALYGAADNDVMCEIIHGLWDKCRPYKVLWASAAARRGDVDIWHYKPELIAATRANDARLAEEILRTSYRRAKIAIRDILTEQTPAS